MREAWPPSVCVDRLTKGITTERSFASIHDPRGMQHLQDLAQQSPGFSSLQTRLSGLSCAVATPALQGVLPSDCREGPCTSAVEGEFSVWTAIRYIQYAGDWEA